MLLYLGLQGFDAVVGLSGLDEDGAKCLGWGGGGVGEQGEEGLEGFLVEVVAGVVDAGQPAGVWAGPELIARKGGQDGGEVGEEEKAGLGGGSPSSFAFEVEGGEGLGEAVAR